MAAKLHYEPALDGLRGIAISLVVVSHMLPPAAFAGWVGVDVFFVLSGYLITRLLLVEAENAGRINFLRFYLRRAMRLMPPLWCLLAFMLVMIALAHHRAGMIWSWIMTATYLMNWNLSLGWGPYDHLAHTWSLAAEEQFYLLWPLAFVFVRNRRPLAWLGAAIAAITIWRIMLVLGGASRNHYKMGFDAHSDPILIGCVLAFPAASIKLKTWLARVPHAWIGAVSILVAGTLIDEPTAGLVGFSAVSIAAAIIIISSETGLLNRALTSPALVFTGKISYALYLWHFALLSLAGTLTPHLGPFVPVIAAYLVATASYFTVERYFRRLKARTSVGQFYPSLQRA